MHIYYSIRNASYSPELPRRNSWTHPNVGQRWPVCGTCVGHTRLTISNAAQNRIGYGVTWVRRAVFNCAPVWKGTLERMPSISRTVSPSIIVLLIFEYYSGELYRSATIRGNRRSVRTCVSVVQTCISIRKYTRWLRYRNELRARVIHSPGRRNIDLISNP